MAPPGPATRLLPPLVLALAGVARGTFTVAAWPRVAVVALGGSVVVNCSRSSCPAGGDGGDVTLGLETPLGATPGPGGRLWQSFRLENVSLWQPGGVTCAARCGHTWARDSARIVVYQPPQRVTLEPVAPVAVGDSVTLRCHVLGAAPLRNLTVTLRRGAETLRTATFGDNGDNGDDNDGGGTGVAVSHLLTVTRGDHGQDVTCHAELSLRPHGPLFARAAAPVTLSVFALPDPPQLVSPSALEAGTVTNVTCLVTGAFPAGDVGVTAALDREPLDVTVRVTGDTVTGDTVTGDTAVAPRGTGWRELSCTARVATVTRTTRRWLRVYSFPEPTLELSPPTAPEGTQVTVTCRAGDTEMPPPMTLLGGSDVTSVTEMPPPMALLGDWDVTGVTPAQGHQADVTGVTRADVTEMPPPMTLRVGDVTDVTEMPPRMMLQVGDVTNVTPAQGHQADVTGVTQADVTKPPPMTPRVGDVTDVTEMPPPMALQRVRDVTNVTLAAGHGADVTEMPPPMTPGASDVTDVTEMPPRTMLRVRDVTNATPAQGHQADVTKPPAMTPRVRDVTEVPPAMAPRAGDVTDVTEVPPAVLLRVGDVPNVTLAEGRRSQLRLRVAARRDRERFWCRATIRVGDKEVTKEVTARLDVLYPPEIPPSGCPASRTWLRGSVASLSCRATGNPVPTVTCRHRGATGAATGAATDVTTGATTGAATGATTDVTTGAITNVTTRATTGATSGATTNVTTEATTDVTTGATTGATTDVTMEPLPVTRDRAGTYVCKATNALGTRSRRVTVRVEYPPSLSESGCPSRRVWLEGQRRQLECHGDGDPPPRTRCHRDGDIGDGGTRHGDISDGDTHHGDIHDGDTRHGGIHDGDTLHGDIRDGGTHRGGLRDGGTRDGDIHGGGGGDTHLGGTRHVVTRHGDTRGGDIHRGDTHGDTPSDTHSGDIHRGDTHPGVTHHGDTHHDDTHGVTHPGVTHPGGVTRADGGRYVCRATNRHGVALRSVIVTVESPPRLSERGCPERRRWLEGSPARLSCAAAGNPRPRVTCHRLGDKGHPRDVTAAGESRDHPGDVIGVGESHGSDVIGVGDSQDHPSDVIGMGDSRDHPSDVMGMRESHPSDVIGMRDKSHPSDVIGIGDSRDHPSDVIRAGESHSGDVIGIGDSRGHHRDVTGTRGAHPSDVMGMREKSHPSDVIRAGESRHRDVIRPGDKSHPSDVTGMRDKSHPSDVTGPGDSQGHPWVSPNVTRGDAGLYRCRATNAHGSAVRNVTVTVEYPPSAVTLRVVPSAAVPRGVTVTVTCGSRGVPGVTFAWSHPGAANLRLSHDNSTVTVTGATAANRGRYTCTASNRHGRSAASVTVTVDESWLVALVALGTLGGVTALALAVAGGCYLRSTACKKGEYNVRDAEGSSEAACLHRGDTGGDIFGIQLTQT